MSVRILLTIAAASSAAACGAQTSGEAGAAGLYGRVLIEPATPTCSPGTPCGRPAPDFELVFLQDGRRVAHATTDKRGRYRALRGRVRRTTAAGAHRLTFRARLGGRRLRAGRSKLVLRASDLAGNHSAARRVAFTVVTGR